MNSWRDFIKLGRTVGATLDRAPKGHPWELIFTYLAMLVYEKGYKVDAEYFRSCIGRSVENAGQAISNIVTYGELRFVQCKEIKINMIFYIVNLLIE